ncbi:unnamed protein product [Diamesa tonsa]
MKTIVMLLVFCVVFQTKALPGSSVGNTRLRPAYNYERQAPDTSYDVKSEVLVLKLSTSTANVLFTTEPMRTSTYNPERSNINETLSRYTTEQQIRTTNQEQIKTTREEQIRSTTESNSSNSRTVETKSENE